MARDSEQPSLFGFEAAPRDKHLILMVYPDQQAKTAAQARARRYQVDNGLGGVVFKPDLMHITLGHFELWDEVPASLIERITRAASKVAMAPFQVSFDQIGGFTGNVVLRGGEGLKALETFHAALRHALAWEKLDGSHMNFTPHLTVVYGQPGAVVSAIEPVSWTVSEFALVISHHGKGRHEVLARYWLVG